MSRTKNPKAKAGDVAKVVRQWLIPLNSPKDFTQVEEARREIIKLYSDERKYETINKFYGVYLSGDGYFHYDSFTKEDCLNAVNLSMVNACTSASAKSITKKMKEMSDSELGNKIMKLVNQRVNGDLQQYIANKNGCSRYQAQQIQRILEKGLDLYTSSAEEILGLLRDFKNGKAKNSARKKEEKYSLHVVYTLRRKLNPAYTYLREIIETELPQADQAALCEIVKERFQNKEDPLLTANKIDDTDRKLFHGYFLATKYMARDDYGKQNKIPSMYRRTEKIADAAKQIVREELQKQKG